MTCSGVYVAWTMLAAKGSVVSAAFSGPTRWLRTAEWWPSAPMTRQPVYEVPSSNRTVTAFPSAE